MPKIRGVKPDYWTDEDIVDLSIPARLMFIGLWSYACDNGHLQDKPKQIKMRLFPGDDVSAAELLRELAAASRIVRDDGWITVPNFAKHQKPDKRFWQTCDKPGCGRPKADSQPETRGAHHERTSSAPRDHVVPTTGTHGDGDCEVDGEGELKVKVNKEPAGKPATSKRHRLPDDFVPNDTNRRIATERGLDLRAVFEHFADHHAAKGTLMVDWHRAFNTWLRNERSAGRPGSRPAKSNVQGWLDLTAEIAEQEHGGTVSLFPRQLGGAS